ncbi:MAG: PKD domain-containing protein [Dinghuibacter sp.]|nr:PKD domain-containing protein [Dinghuibacter sp.]
MKKKLMLLFLSALCVTVSVLGQRYIVSNGTSRQEEKWAVVEDPAINGYVAVGNSTATGISNFWLSSYNPNGVLLSSVTFSNDRNMIARDVSIAPFEPGVGNTYYVTGWTDINGMNQMFVSRVSLNGVVLWTHINPAGTEVDEMEGVALVTEPNTRDVVVLGIARWTGNIPPAPQVTLSRFDQNGVQVWSRFFVEKGDWMPREIDLGPYDQPSVTPGDFVITGEVVKDGNGVPVTFAARYDGTGAELWRNLYPAFSSSINTTGDAGYDVVWEPRTRNFCVVGVAQTTDQRAGVNSTPYILAIDRNGPLVAASIYLTPGGVPMGMYPRCVSLGRTPGDGSVIFAGPDYNFENGQTRTFFGTIPNITPPGPGLFEYFNWSATANSVPQPFVLNDAWPEDILYTNLDNNPGALISTNGVPGDFGAGDAVLIKTDVNWQTPTPCPEKIIPHLPKDSYKIIAQSHQKKDIPDWPELAMYRIDYQVEQKFCNNVNPCDVVAAFTQSINCKTVTFTSTPTGTGPFTYAWNFGDGNTSTLANPVHTYAACGLYNVTLIVCSTTLPNCCDTIVQAVNVPCCSVTSDFCVTTFGRVATLNINTGANPPVTTYQVFVNGISTVWPNNTNLALAAGNNTICVKATRIACGDTCCATTCKTVFATDTCNLVANFWFQVRNNGQVVFTNQSTPTAGLTYSWAFGPPGATSTLASPVYVYPGPGTYTACLTIRRISGMDTCEQKVCKTIVIDPPCSVQAKFSARHCVLTPTTVSFSNASTGTGPFTYEWSFGDGNTSTAVNPTHTYAAPGTYIVCLKTLVNNNCWSRSCHKVIVSSVTSNNSCSVLPGNPTFRVADPLKDPLIVENIMEPVAQDASPNNVLAVQAPANNLATLPLDKLSLFPNPASQQVQAMFTSTTTAAVEVVVVNASGNLVYKKAAPAAAGKNQWVIPVQKLAKGLYIVRLKTGEQTLSSHFFVDSR